MLRPLLVAGVFALTLPAAARADDITVTLTPYVWLPSIEGPFSVDSSRPTPSVDSSGGPLDNLKFFGFALGEVSGERFGALTDLSYVSLKFDHTTTRLPPAVALTADLDAQAAVGALSGFYRLHDGDRLDLDILAGVRGFWIKTDLTLSGPNQVLLTGDAEASWADGVVGARAKAQLGRLGLTGLADAGWGSDTSSWQGLALADYAFGEHWSVVAGYRYLSLKNHRRRADLDLSLSGPVLGFTLRF